MIPLLAFLCGSALGLTAQYFPYVSALLFLAFLAGLSRKRRFAAALVLSLGVVYSYAHYASPAEPLPTDRKYLHVEGFFESPAVERPSGFWQDFRSGGATFSVLSRKERFQIGRWHAIRVRPSVQKVRANPGSRQWDPFAVLLGVEETGPLVNSPSIFFNRIRERLNGAIRERFPSDSAAFIMAVTTGFRADMSRELRDAFNVAGVAHLLSISGTHFGLFSLLLFGLFRGGVKALPLRALEAVTAHLTPSQIAALCTLPFMLLYLGVSGASIPSTRSFVMISLFLLGILIGRRGAWLNFLLLAAVLLVAWDPGVLESLSFQLSFTAVLFIGWGLAALPRAEPDIESSAGDAALRYIKKTFLITVFASLGVAPLVAYYFHYASLISPVSNFIVTPLVCFLMVPLSLVGAFSYILFGSYVTALPLEMVAGASIALTKGFSAVPLSSVQVGQFPPGLLLVYYVGFGLFWTLRKRSFLVAALAPLIVYSLFAAFQQRPLAVTALDAGRGDASVIELPDGKVFVVDTGWSGREVAEYLRFAGVRAVDALILTNSRRDHAGGLRKVLERFDVREIWDSGRNSYPSGILDGVTRRVLARGDVIEGPGYRLSVLHPYEGFRAKRDKGNNQSLAFRLEGRGTSFLFASNIEREAALDILGSGAEIRSDALRLSSYGLASSGEARFMEAVSPTLAVVSGEKLVAGTEEALRGARVLLTGRDGAVKVEDRAEGPREKLYADQVVVKTRSPREEMGNIGRMFAVW